MTTTTFLGHGVYSFAEAAKLSRLRPVRVREWFCVPLSEGSRVPLFRGDYRALEGQRSISFLDLIELFIAGQLRDHGVSLQSLRQVQRQFEKDLKTRHSFCRAKS